MIKVRRTRSKSTMQTRITKMHKRVRAGKPPVQILEWQLQAQVATWLDIKRRQGLLEYFAVPNGAWLGGSTPAQKAKVMHRLKQQGFRTGVSDLVILLAHSQRTLWLELKRPEESTELHGDQLAWASWLKDHDYIHACSSNVDEITGWISYYIRAIDL
jgi:hypothetical protein